MLTVGDAGQAAQEREAWQRQWSQDKSRLLRERDQLAGEVQVKATLPHPAVWVVKTHVLVLSQDKAYLFRQH